MFTYYIFLATNTYLFWNTKYLQTFFKIKTRPRSRLKVMMQGRVLFYTKDSWYHLGLRAWREKLHSNFSRHALTHYSYNRLTCLNLLPIIGFSQMLPDDESDQCKTHTVYKKNKKLQMMNNVCIL